MLEWKVTQGTAVMSCGERAALSGVQVAPPSVVRKISSPMLQRSSVLTTTVLGLVPSMLTPA